MEVQDLISLTTIQTVSPYGLLLGALFYLYKEKNKSDDKVDKLTDKLTDLVEENIKINTEIKEILRTLR